MGDSEGPLQDIYAPKASFGVLATNALAGTCTPIFCLEAYSLASRASRWGGQEPKLTDPKKQLGHQQGRPALL